MGHWNLPALRSVPVRAFRCQPHHDPARPSPARIATAISGSPGPAGRSSSPTVPRPRRPGSSSRSTTSWPWSAMRASRSKLGEGSARRRMRRSWACAAATPLPCLRGILSRRQSAYARSIIYFPPAIGSRLRAARLRRRRRLPGPAARARRPHRRRPADRLGRTANARGCRRACGCDVGSALLVTQLLYRDDAGALGGGRLQPLARVRGAPVDPSDDAALQAS